MVIFELDLKKPIECLQRRLFRACPLLDCAIYLKDKAQAWQEKVDYRPTQQYQRNPNPFVSKWKDLHAMGPRLQRDDFFSKDLGVVCKSLAQMGKTDDPFTRMLVNNAC